MEVLFYGIIRQSQLILHLSPVEAHEISTTKFFFIFLSLEAFADIHLEESGLREKLVEVNSEWLNIEPGFKPGELADDPVELHLRNALSYLKEADTSKLTSEQLLNREQHLLVLDQYITDGSFLLNSFSEKRIPIFIDDQNNFCAVGHLLKASDQENLARTINNNFRFSKLREIKSEQLVNWQQSSGLTLDELALIQPGYSGYSSLTYRCGHVGQKPEIKLCQIYYAVKRGEVEEVERILSSKKDPIEVKNIPTELVGHMKEPKLIPLFLAHGFDAVTMIRKLSYSKAKLMSVMEFVLKEKPDAFREVYSSQFDGWLVSKRMLENFFKQDGKLGEVDLETSFGFFVSTNEELKIKYKEKIQEVRRSKLDESKRLFAFEKALGSSLTEGKNLEEKLKLYSTELGKTRRKADEIGALEHKKRRWSR